MESILELLYTDLSQMKTPDYPGRKKAMEEYMEMCDLIKEQYGADFVDRLEALQREIIGHAYMAEFTMGFRACARLVLELLER